MTKILSQELNSGVTVNYLPTTVIIKQGDDSIELTDSQLKIIRDTIRENSKSNGVVNSKEGEK